MNQTLTENEFAEIFIRRQENRSGKQTFLENRSVVNAGISSATKSTS
jgi:hypothetical protein